MTDDETVNPEIDQSAAFRLAADIVFALDDLPILERLEIAKNLVEANGGHKHAAGSNFQLMVVYDILGDVIKVLERHPTAAKLRTAEPEPS
jgi:hypothetical protein